MNKGEKKSEMGFQNDKPNHRQISNIVTYNSVIETHFGLH